MKIKILSLLSLLLALTFTGMSAQNIPGSWSVIPTLGSVNPAAGKVDIVETPTRTFVLAGGFLMSLSDDETYYYDRHNKLSDSYITLIRYNFEKGYLFIAYSNGNIDLLYDNDRVVNMPELKDAILTTAHTINNVDFGHDRIALSTLFGIVIYDDERHEVVESGIYNTSIRNAMIMGDRLMLYTAPGQPLLVAPLNARHPRLDNFTPMVNSSGAALNMWDDIAKLSDNAFVRRAVSNNDLLLYTIQPEGHVVSSWLTQNATASGVSTLCYGNGMVSFGGAAKSLIVGNDATVTTLNIPTDRRGQTTYSTTGAGSIWTAGRNGITRLNLADNKNEVTMDWFTPAASPVIRVAQLEWTADGRDLYISHIAQGRTITALNYPMQTAVLTREGDIRNISNTSINTTHHTRVDVDDPELFYVTAGFAGIKIMRGAQQIHQLSGQAFPFPQHTVVKCSASSSIDPEGNFWVVNYVDAGDTNTLVFLPANKRREGNWAQLTTADWQVHPANFNSRVAHFETQILFNSKKPYALINNTTYEGGYMMISHKGTYSDFSDDTYTVHPTIVDQTGASPSESNAIVTVAEDKNGAFWLGSYAGVFVMQDPAAAMDPSYKLTRPIVARNDGTNFGDYLLSTDKIQAIAVDHTNRKWIGTEASGLYLVSADGSEILEHFTTDNSPLPTNNIYAVTVDPLGSAVYIGTDYGLYVYEGASSPASDDYSDVYVYPNPVRPDFTGAVVISGLMDNSLVKIADASGNVVYTTRSEGGTATWHVCNSDGRRVRSGVYFVLSSQNENGNTGVVSKIMVIN